MRYFLLLGFILVLFSCNNETITYADKAPDHDLWDVLLQRHVSDEGAVNYEGFITDSVLLNQYLDILSAHHPNPDKWTDEEQLAYWINAYNAFTIKLIIDNYPLASIKDITVVNIPLLNSPWDRTSTITSNNPASMACLKCCGAIS